MALLIGYLFNKADDTERGVQDKVGAMYFIITTQVCFFKSACGQKMWVGGHSSGASRLLSHIEGRAPASLPPI